MFSGCLLLLVLRSLNPDTQKLRPESLQAIHIFYTVGNALKMNYQTDWKVSTKLNPRCDE